MSYRGSLVSTKNKLQWYPQQPQRFIFTNLSEVCCEAKRWKPCWTCWTWPGLAPKIPKTFSGTFSATFSGTHWTWLGFTPRFLGTISGTFSGTCGTFSGTFSNLFPGACTSAHRSWAEDPMSLRWEIAETAWDSSDVSENKALMVENEGFKVLGFRAHWTFMNISLQYRLKCILKSWSWPKKNNPVQKAVSCSKKVGQATVNQPQFYHKRLV